MEERALHRQEGEQKESMKKAKTAAWTTASGSEVPRKRDLQGNRRPAIIIIAQE